MNRLQTTLEAESAKCKKLLTLLDDTIHENDIVRVNEFPDLQMEEDLESLRVELQKRISSEIEYVWIVKFIEYRQYSIKE